MCKRGSPTHVPAKFEVATSNSLEDAFTRKYIIWTLTLGSRSYKLLSTLYIVWPIHLQDLRLLRPTFKDEIHL